MSSSESPDRLKHTALRDAHVALGARMAPFAGYEMPIQYEGVLAEHRWTRDSAGLFDVSHMGPAFLVLNAPTGEADADHKTVAALVEPLVPGDIAGLSPGRLRYTMLLNQDGGILDDLFIGRPGAGGAPGRLIIIVNAGTKDADFALIEAAAGDRATLQRLSDHALLALQGPKAVEVLEGLIPGVSAMTFMTVKETQVDGYALVVSRSGYTGEDGFEILAPGAYAQALWDRLLSDERVRPVGLAARDSLRLEAGLPLYGHDLDETVSPVEAGLSFALSKRRLLDGDFPGAKRIMDEMGDGPTRARVALKVQGAPAREGAEIAEASGTVVGRVTSGGFAPSLGAPIAIGFVPAALAVPGGELQVIVRRKAQPAEVVALPFVPHRYVRKPS